MWRHLLRTRLLALLLALLLVLPAAAAASPRASLPATRPHLVLPPPGGAVPGFAHRNLPPAPAVHAADIAAGRPVTPMAHALVVLVDFPDQPASLAPSGFTQRLFGDGADTLRAFYRENSGGLFDIAGTAGPIWVRAGAPRAAYGGDNDPRPLVAEAVRGLAAAGFDFSPYRAANGTLAYLFVVHSGQGQEVTGNKADVWSHRWQLGDQAFAVSTSAGPATVNDYIMQPEYGLSLGKPSGIGVFCHEFGHLLGGLPDLYDVTYKSEGVGFWSLMGAGAWLGAAHDGSMPAHFDAWSKTVFHWARVHDLAAGDLTLAPVAQAGDVYRVRLNPSEYYLLEVRGPGLGHFEQYLPGGGLLVWRVDARIMDDPEGPYRQSNMVNALCQDQGCPPHYGLRLEEAGGYALQEHTGLQYAGSAADPFPGSRRNTAFTAGTSPSARDWEGQDDGAALTGIAFDGALVRLHATVPGSTAPAPTLSYTIWAGGRQLVAVPGDAPLFRTNQTRVLVRGTAAPNAEVTARGAHASAGADGSFELALKVPANKETPITLAAAAAGHTVSSDLRIAVRTRPFKVHLSKVMGPDGKAIKAPYVGREGVWHLQGSTAVDATLAASLDDAPGSRSDTGRRFDVTVRVAGAGAHTARLDAVDVYGNTSTLAVTLRVDDEPPLLLDVQSNIPADGHAPTGFALSVWGSATDLIAGERDPRALAHVAVTLKHDSQQRDLKAKVDAAGNFRLAPHRLSRGDYTVVVEAVDRSGNRSRPVELTVLVG